MMNGHSRLRRFNMLLGGAALAVGVFRATPALAQNRGEWLPDTHRSGAGGEIYMWSARGVGTVMPLIGFANIGFADEFFIDIHLPIATNLDGFGDTSRAGLGNPTGAFRYAPTMGIVRWWVGGGLGLPMASLEDRDWQFANFMSLAATAGYDSHLWVTDAVPLHATGGADIRVTDYLSVQASAKLILAIAAFNRRETEVALQNRVGVEFRDQGTGLGGGAHFKLVYGATNTAGGFGADRGQVSIEPFFAWTAETFFLRFGLLTALDRPLGFGLDRGKVFAPHLTLGGQW